MHGGRSGRHGLGAAGDSHTMALTREGEVWGWGTFRDSSGVYGFAPGTRMQLSPALVYAPPTPEARVAKISSGAMISSTLSLSPEKM